MKMRIAIRNRYLRFLLPVFVGLLLLAFVALWIGGFGIRFQFSKPTPLKEMTADRLSGAYVTLPVADSGESFTYRGYVDAATGATVIGEQYTVCQVDGKYLVIRVPRKELPKLNKYIKAAESVQKGELGSILEVNLGSFTGTVNPLGKEVGEQLRSWFVNHQIDAGELTDELNGRDISGYPGAEDGDFDAYLDDVILPLQLDVGSLGARSAGFVKTTTVVAAVLVLLALALLATIFLGLWEKPTREAVRQHTQKLLSADYDGATVFGPRLRIGREFLWVSGAMFTRILENKYVIWAYPRNRRLEGGKQKWGLVLKTDYGSEAVAWLSSEAEVEQAVACLRSRGNPLTAGFDKEKQKLYKKDLNAFRNRVRNGTL